MPEYLLGVALLGIAGFVIHYGLRLYHPWAHPEQKELPAPTLPKDESPAFYEERVIPPQEERYYTPSSL